MGHYHAPTRRTMATTTTIVGGNTGDSLIGTAGDDLLYGFDPAGEQATTSVIAATRVAAGLASPLFAASAPGDGSHLFIVERGGQIELLDLNSGKVEAAPFLDI